MNSESYAVTYDHYYSYIETVKPTCISEGYDLYRCSLCGDEYQDNFTDMIDHDFEWIVDFDKKDCSLHGYYKCSACDYIDPFGHTHTYEHRFDTESKVVEPTCTEGGYTYLECSNCGYQSKSDFTAPLGHDYEFIIENIYCNGNAEGYKKCKRCNDIILGATEPGYTPTNHHYITVDDVEVVDATCTTEGYHKGKCQYCGKEVIDEGLIGDLYYLYSTRIKFGVIRTEENVFWSFAPHDIAVLDYLVGTPAEKIQVHTGNFLQSNIADYAMAQLDYPNNIKAHIQVSWLHPFKEQRLVAVGSKGMLWFDDAGDKQIRFCDKHVEWNDAIP